MEEALKDMRSFIATARRAGNVPERVQTSQELLRHLRSDLGLPEGADVVVDGVPFGPFDSPRDEEHSRAQSYARYRWDINMEFDDIVSLFKAVPDAEMHGLVAIMVDQHMDMNDVPDPVLDMDADEVEGLNEVIRDLGIEHEVS